MAKYVSLINWTEQGIGSFRETVDRFDAARKIAADMGGSLEAHWTLGEFDIVAIMEFPDDETATAFLLKVGSLGNLRSRSMRAFDADEMSRIIGAAAR
jgi:uncharacterized protein with GYD domain